MKLFILFATIFLAGCIISPPMPELPDFKQVTDDCPKPPLSVVTKQQATCPHIDLPEPIPTTVLIDIQEGRIVKIDDGGEKLIRRYAATRKVIKALNEIK